MIGNEARGVATEEAGGRVVAEAVAVAEAEVEASPRDRTGSC